MRLRWSSAQSKSNKTEGVSSTLSSRPQDGYAHNCDKFDSLGVRYVVQIEFSHALLLWLDLIISKRGTTTQTLSYLNTTRTQQRDFPGNNAYVQSKVKDKSHKHIQLLEPSHLNKLLVSRRSANQSNYGKRILV